MGRSGRRGRDGRMGIDVSRLRGFSFFAGMDDAALEKIAAQARFEQYKARQPLFIEGDYGDKAFIILSGAVRIEHFGAEGRSLMLDILGPGEMFGEMAIITGRPRSASATAHTDSDLCIIGKTCFHELQRLNPHLNEALMALLSTRLTSTTNRLEQVGLAELEQRLAGILVSFARRYGREQPDGATAIDLPLSQSDLAALAVCSREHINKIIKGWTAEGIVSHQRQRINIIAINRLYDKAG